MPRAKNPDTEIAPAPSPSPVVSTMVGPTDDMGSKEEVKQAANRANLKGKKFVNITIHPGAGGDMSDVVIGHNYRLNVYKRNVAVDMDLDFFNVLRDSVVHTTVQSQDGSTNTAVSIPQYQWTVNS